MNTIIFSALWGVVMMFAGAFLKNPAWAKYIAITGILLLFIVNAIELQSGSFFEIDTKDMLRTNSFNLTFLAVILACTLLYFLLSGRDIEKVGKHVSEYFALIFFILCGVALSITFN